MKQPALATALVIGDRVNYVHNICTILGRSIYRSSLENSPDISRRWKPDLSLHLSVSEPHEKRYLFEKKNFKWKNVLISPKFKIECT